MDNLNKMNYTDFYKTVGEKQGWSFDKMNYTKICSQNFDYHKFLKDNITSNDVVFNIGCGDSKKVIKNVDAKIVYNIDITPEMIEKSIENYNSIKPKTHHEFLIGDAFGKYEFDDNTFDYCINRHCGCNEVEMHRVLKNGGIYIQEDIDETDCLELKILFNRGQGYPLTNRLSDKLFDIYKKLNFSQINYYPIREVEYYKSKEDLKYLLENTPIIPNFGQGKDDYSLFDHYCITHQTSKGIRLDRELFGYILIK